MEDYKKAITELLLDNFAPQKTDNNSEEKLLSTSQVLKMVQGIIPKQPIGEHEIYEVLKSIGFKKILHTKYKENKKDKPVNKIDYQVFLWRFFYK